MGIPTSWPSFPDGISVFDIRNLPSKVCFQSDSQDIRILHTSSQSMVIPSRFEGYPPLLPNPRPPGFPSPPSLRRHHASGNPNPPSQKSGERKEGPGPQEVGSVGTPSKDRAPPPLSAAAAVHLLLLMKRQKADDLQQQSESGMRSSMGWHTHHTQPRQLL